MKYEDTLNDWASWCDNNKNFMTPEILLTGHIPRANIYYELSRGGHYTQRLYGVTFRIFNGKDSFALIDYPLSQSFPSYALAKEYLDEVQREIGVQDIHPAVEELFEANP